jgi:hypothetical protein
MSHSKREHASGGHRDGSNKRQHHGREEDEDDMPVNQQILEALKTQNGLLKSIDARLGRFERQERGSNLRQQRVPQEKAVSGSWKFLENPRAGDYGASRSSGSFGRTDGEGLMLTGDSFGTYIHPSAIYDCPYSGYSHENDIPNWSSGGSSGGRHLLPQLLFNDKAKLPQRSGVYSLSIMYSNSRNQPSGEPIQQEAGIVVGEMEFSNGGFVMAKGADWDRLLNGQRQTQLPYAHGARGVPCWRRRKISEPWEDGEELKFRVDTNENTIVFKKGDTPEKIFWNVLAFTNNQDYPDFLCVYAYCGGFRQLDQLDVKLTIIPTQSDC